MTSDQWTAIIGIGTIIVMVGTLILIVIGIVPSFRLGTVFRDALVVTMLSAVVVLVFPPHPRGEPWAYIVSLALAFVIFALYLMLWSAGQYIIFPSIYSRWQAFLDRRRGKAAAEAAKKAAGSRPKP